MSPGEPTTTCRTPRRRWPWETRSILVSDNGIASCRDIETGELHWRHRVGGNYSASPVHAAGRIYLVSEQGVCTVIAAGREYRELATNDLQEPTLASCAVVDGRSSCARQDTSTASNERWTARPLAVCRIVLPSPSGWLRSIRRSVDNCECLVEPKAVKHLADHGAQSAPEQPASIA